MDSAADPYFAHFTAVHPNISTGLLACRTATRTCCNKRKPRQLCCILLNSRERIPHIFTDTVISYTSTAAFMPLPPVQDFEHINLYY
ncbi:hypothetical protein DPMN_163106 [Dreissena polymorpha]|uniref:Uncharacterized protein n=1 Tax=Dreissena polymorpha TaxID=45954 RepID=A0A9D4ETB8_DREPO|nr:hypothetical protein DPMN_163106 [Dreissena polymorpha]